MGYMLSVDIRPTGINGLASLSHFCKLCHRASIEFCRTLALHCNSMLFEIHKKDNNDGSSEDQTEK